MSTAALAIWLVAHWERLAWYTSAATLFSLAAGPLCGGKVITVLRKRRAGHPPTEVEGSFLPPAPEVDRSLKVEVPPASEAEPLPFFNKAFDTLAADGVLTGIGHDVKVWEPWGFVWYHFDESWRSTLDAMEKEAACTPTRWVDSMAAESALALAA